jgi:hypothetical protein
MISLHGREQRLTPLLFDRPTIGVRSNRRNGEGSSEINLVWDKLWALQVPSNVKIFLWRALLGVAPGMTILEERHIKVPAQCPVCQHPDF